MPLIAEYRVLTIPRFSLDERDIREYDAWLAQRALWSVLIFQMVRKHGATVELSYGCTDPGEPAFVALRLHGQNSTALAADLRQVDALLPGEYRWQGGAAVPRPSSQVVRVARVVRRIEYMDLPAAALGAMRGTTWTPQAAAAAGGAQTPAFSVSSGRFTLGFQLGEGEPLRAVPAAETSFGELMARQFCLPIPGPMTAERPRLMTVFQGIQRAGMAVVSICLHPIGTDVRRKAQAVALNFQRFLGPFADAIATSGFADPHTVHAAFSRFGLPEGYLFYGSVRVAAPTNEAAVGIANLVAESSGGAQGFRVIAPTRDAALASLHDPQLDVPGPDWSDARREAVRRQFHDDMQSNAIETPEDPATIDFLIRLPHVYAIQEALNMLRLPQADEEGLPGLDTQQVPPFSLPSLPFIPVVGGDAIAPPPQGRFRVGMVQKAGLATAARDGGRFANYAWHTLDPLDLTKHAFIVGSTGSGKTMTTLFLVRELVRLKVPVMIIEPVKTEYYAKLHGLVPNLKRMRLEGAPDGGGPGEFFLHFDPLRVPAGISVARHCSYLKSCFEAAFGMTDWLALLLENGLRAYYEAPEQEGGCGLGKYTRGGYKIGKVRGGKVYPSFATFRTYLIDVYLKRELAAMAQSKVGGDAALVIEAFKRRFVNLGDGVMGDMFRVADDVYVMTGQNPRTYDTFDAFLQMPMVIELDALADADHKALVMAFLMTKLFEHRQAEDFACREAGTELPPGLRHFLVVEEAHRLLSTGAAGSSHGKDIVGDTAKSKAVQLFVDMLAEVRAFGQGLAIVEQIPTKIVPEAVKNTNLKIMLRLTAKDDREYLGDAMNFTERQMRFVTNLKVEPNRQINFVVFEEGVEQPLLLSLPLPDRKSHDQNRSRDPYADHFIERRSS